MGSSFDQRSEYSPHVSPVCACCLITKRQGRFESSARCRNRFHQVQPGEGHRFSPQPQTHAKHCVLSIFPFFYPPPFFLFIFFFKGIFFIFIKSLIREKSTFLSFLWLERKRGKLYCHRNGSLPFSAWEQSLLCCLLSKGVIVAPDLHCSISSDVSLQVNCWRWEEVGQM